MRLDLLKELLAVPTRFRHEDQVVAFIADHVRGRGPARCGEVVTDPWNNLFIRKGRAEIVPCVAARTDTVHRPKQVEILQEEGILRGRDEPGERTGCGADDKCGVFICLELLERFDNMAVALFAQEEIGCVGAYHAPAAWFRDVGYVIEFDCPASGLVSYTSASVRLFGNDGAVIRTAKPVLGIHELTRWEHRPFTDVMALRERFDFSCFNLSCGYRNWLLSGSPGLSQPGIASRKNLSIRGKEGFLTECPEISARKIRPLARTFWNALSTDS
jgi:tripeptide aminopeptidase